MRMTFVVLISLLWLAGCDSNDSTTGKDASHSAESDTHTNPAPAPDTLVRVLHNLERTDEQCEGDHCAQVSIEWVTFENQPELNQAIETRLASVLVQQEGNTPHDGTIEGLAEAFLTDASDMAMGSQGWSLSARVSRQSRRGDLLTLRFESNEYTGGAHGNPAVSFFHWDLAAQQRLSLDDLLVPGQQNAFWDLARTAHTQWLDRQKLDRNFRESWPFDRTEQAYFSKQGLVLLYNVYHIAPYAMGQPELTLPYPQLDGIVRDSYLNP